MPRKHNYIHKTGRNILIVDDNKEYLESTGIILKNEGHNIFKADRGEAALKIIKEINNIDLILLDYYMPEMTGEELVKEVRKFNNQIQIILQTGYASEKPPRELLKRLDIQGYYDKGDGVEKLLLWVDVGLKSARSIQVINKSKSGMNYILNITPDLHKIRPVDDLLKLILLHISRLLGAANSFLSVLPPFDQEQDIETVYEGFLAIFKEDAGLQVHAGTGKFESLLNINDFFQQPDIIRFEECLQNKKFTVSDEYSIIPLSVGENSLGLIFIDKNIDSREEIDLLNIYANQAAVAIQNSMLYEMATLDPLTKVYTRRFFFQMLLKELRMTYRTGLPISVLLVDLDNLKMINDNEGHLAGDKALSLIGHILNKSCRNSDIVGRYGGDEFIIVLPQTDKQGSEKVAQKIFENISMDRKEKGFDLLNCSIGSCSLHRKDGSKPLNKTTKEYYLEMANILIESADKNLYNAKKSGKGCYIIGEPIEWILAEEEK